MLPSTASALTEPQAGPIADAYLKRHCVGIFGPAQDAKDIGGIEIGHDKGCIETRLSIPGTVRRQHVHYQWGAVIGWVKNKSGRYVDAKCYVYNLRVSHRTKKVTADRWTDGCRSYVRAIKTAKD